MTDGPALSGVYTATCPYCQTHIVNARGPRGAYDLVSDAAKALNGHLLYVCTQAPRLPSRHRKRIVAEQIRSLADA